MAFTTTEEKRIQTIEAKLNEIQTSLNNLANKKDLKTALFVLQRQVTDLSNLINQFKQTNLGELLIIHENDTAAHQSEMDIRYFNKDLFVASSSGIADANKPVKLNNSGKLDTTLFLNEDQYLLVNGSRSLTADWDAGSYKITAEQLESDVGSGIQPFLVSSNTKVDNLNADLLDNYDGSYYLNSNNFIGTEWDSLTNNGTTSIHTHSHLILDDIGVNTHAQIDTHLADNNVHFTESSIDHGSISGLDNDDHPQYLNTTRGDARYYTETELDAGQLDNRYYTETESDSTFAPIAKGVTNGDSHDHNGGDGAQIDHTTLSNKGTSTHAQIDSHIAAASNYLLISNIDDTPVNGETSAPISSNWAYDHVAAADPHTGYRLESADHTHQSTGLQGGKLDHGLALNGLSDDDHTQYVLTDGTRPIDGDLTISGILTVAGQIRSNIPAVHVPTGTTQTIDWDDSHSQLIDLENATGDVTLTLTNPLPGASYVLQITQGSVARNIIWPVDILWPDGITPIISTDDNAIDAITLFYNGTSYLCNTGQNYL